MKPEDALIVQQLRDGDSKAWRYLYDHHYKVLCHIASQYIHDDYMAETIVGDVIFHLWQVRERIEISTSLRKYLLRCVRNRCLDVLKSDTATSELPLSAAGDGTAMTIDMIADDRQPLGTLLENELEQMVRDAIDALPDTTRQVFRMSRYDNMKYADIAAQMDISVNTVKYHIKRALAILADSLGRYLILAIAILPPIYKLRHAA